MRHTCCCCKVCCILLGEVGDLLDNFVEKKVLLAKGAVGMQKVLDAAPIVVLVSQGLYLVGD